MYVLATRDERCARVQYTGSSRQGVCKGQRDSQRSTLLQRTRTQGNTSDMLYYDAMSTHKTA
jgi:hypothetical protein